MNGIFETIAGFTLMALILWLLLIAAFIIEPDVLSGCVTYHPLDVTSLPYELVE
jgi:hypothetical protein